MLLNLISFVAFRNEGSKEGQLVAVYGLVLYFSFNFGIVHLHKLNSTILFSNRMTLLDINQQGCKILVCISPKFVICEDEMVYFIFALCNFS